MLTGNQRFAVSIFVTILIVLGIYNTGYADITPVSERTSQVRDAIVTAAGVDTAADVTETHLGAITSLNLRAKSISTLNSGDFSGLTGLTSLNLYGNELSSLPDGIFEGLTALTTLRLGGNTVDPMPITVSLEKVADGQFKAVVPTGALFDIVLPISATNGTIASGVTTITIAKGSTESNIATMSRTVDTTAAVTANIGTLPRLPLNHYGYVFTKSNVLPLEILSAVTTTPPPVEPPIEPPPVEPPIEPPVDPPTTNTAPVFTDGTVAIQSIAENAAAGTNIGTAVSATDANEGDTLTYTLGGIDATSFEIDSTNGQLKTKNELDYEMKRVYSITISVSDGSLTDTITVIVSVIDVDDTPFVSTILAVSDRTPEVRDAIVASVLDVSSANEVTDAHLAAITSLNLRSAGITELKSGDFSGMTGLTSLNLYGNMLNTLPMGIFEGLSSLNSLRLGGNLIDPLPLIVSVQQMDVSKFRAVVHTGAPFDILLPIGAMMVTIPKGSLTSAAFTALSTPNINALPALPANHFGYVLAKSTVCNRTIQVSDAIVNALPGIDDCRNVSEVHLATITSLNLSNMSLTSLKTGDFAGMLSLTTLNLDNNQLSSLPDGIFDGLTALTTVDLSGNFVSPLPLSISLQKVGSNQIKAVVPTGAPFEIVLPIAVANGSSDGSALTISTGNDESQTLTVTRTSGMTAAVTVDIALPSLPISHRGYALVKSNLQPLEMFEDINIAPVFADGESTTRTVAENTVAGTNIGAAVAATDVNGDTLTYSLGGTDAASFDIDTGSGQLKTRAALDYESKDTYSITVTAYDGKLTPTRIIVTINITDVDETPSNNSPVFDEGSSTSRTVVENTGSGVDIGTAVSATDADGNTLSYSLGGTDASSFSIDSTTGQLRTTASLDYETQSTYTVTLTVSDGSLIDSITVTINITDVDETPSNNSPVFDEGSSTSRTVVENTGSGVDIGTAVSATDADGNTLSYSLGGTDASSFSIDSTTGQLRTTASLDYETQSTYTVTLTVSDGSLIDSITVTINITDVDETPSNNSPVFDEGSSTSRTVVENTGSGVDIGTAVSATDADGNTLSYSLGGTDASSFSIDSTTGQLRTTASPDYETQSTYTVTLTVTDGSLTDSITVTINITDVDETPSNNSPVFDEGSSTSRTVVENTGSGVDIGTAVSATDADGNTLSYSLGGTDASSFSIDSTTGQLRTSSSLDYEIKSTYTVTLTVTDGSLTDSITVTINITDVDETPSNNSPVFAEGSSTSRTVVENTGSGVDIGSAVSAADADGNTLSYSLGGTDASSFSIDSTSGQLRTSSSLNYETKTTYSVTVTASDGSLTDSITVTINVTDTNDAPVFIAGTSTTRSIAENTNAGVNIGSVISATDDEADTLTYSIGGTDAAAFTLISTSGQLQTSAALDYETKTSYTVTVSVSDGNGGSDSINVTINITDVDENSAPIFTDGTTTTRSIAENAPADTNIGAAISATDPDDNTLAYTLSGTDAASFSIDTATGQLKTSADLDFETKTIYTVTITVTDGSLTDTITVTINITDVNENSAPIFTDGTTTTRSIAENAPADTNIGAAISATDPDDNTLAYTLSGTDAASFSIDTATGQLKTIAVLDFETKTIYTVTITVTDGSLTDTITVTINVTDLDETPSNIPPVFTEGNTATRSVAENTASNTNIGTPVAATDVDNNTLAYLLSGADAAAFSIDSGTGQLKTSAALNYEVKSSYAVIITVTDGTLRDTITVTINVTDANDAPIFTDGTTTTRSIVENTVASQNIGSAVAATDVDSGNTLTYTLGGTDASSFSINRATGQLRTSASLDYESKNSYSVTVTVSDGSLTDTINVTINVTDADENRAPVFTDGGSTTRSVPENTGSGANIGTAVAATDADSDDTLTYSLGGTDAASFTINSTNGQLRTSASLDYETKNAYSVTVTVSDGSLTDTINVTINVTDADENRAPVFTDGDSTARSVAENTGSGANIGTAVAATDADSDDTLTYSLGGTDAASFTINSTNGQLRTNAALDYETKTSYSVTVSVSDGNGGSDSITVTINVTNVNENRAPVFTDGGSTTRSVPENTGSGANIGTAVAATDADSDDTLTYSLGGTDAASFTINSTNGQLRTNAALDYETKTSYSVTVSVSDGNGGSDSITVTINVTNVNENRAPVFTDGGSTTRSVPENTGSGANIGTAVAATDADSDDTLTYSLGGTDAASFTINSTNGQLRTNAALDYETKTSYSVTVSVSDGNGGSDSITVTINVTNVNENRAPVFTDGDSTARSVAENTGSGVNIGSAVGATDADSSDTLTYLLAGTDASSFSIDSTNGQLRTDAALDYETKNAYSVTVTVSDGSLTDTINVTINVTDVNENRAPVFTEGASTTRSVAENTLSGVNIGTAVAATDADSSDTLTYSLGGTDASSFTINSTNGQLRTSAALDYETKTSYTVTVSVSDGNSGTDSITVTINVTDVADTNNAPSFTDGTTATRSVAENTASGQNIGTAVAATDADSSDTLTYLLRGTDASSFNIDSTNGQLRTDAALDYETKNAYSVTVTVSDGSLTDTINVTINVTDVNEAPVFTDSSFTYTIDMSTATVGDNIDDALTATDPDGDMLTFSVGGADAAYFSISSDNSSPTRSGQLQVTQTLIDNTRFTYAINVIADDGKGGTAEIAGTIEVFARISTQMTNNSPVFTEGSSTTRSVAENTAAGVNIGSAIGATDADNDTLTYTLSGADAASFDIDSTTGQLKTKTALDYETKTTYTVVVTATDDSGVASTNSANITVTINVTDVAESTIDPPLSERTPQVRNAIVAAAGVSDPADVTEEHLAAITSLELLNKGIRTLKSGDFDGLTALRNLHLSYNNISDISALAGLTNLNKLLMNNMSLSDLSPLSGLTNLKTLHLSSNDISDISPLSGLTNLTTLALSSNSISELSPLSGLTSLSSLNLADNSISDVSPLEGVTSLRSLSLRSNSISDHGPLRRLKAAIEAAGRRLNLDIKIPNIPPTFVSTTDFSYTIDMSTANVGDNIGDALTATDPDGDMLTFSVGGAHAFYFRISSDNSSPTPSGQLQVTQALIDHTRINYSINVIVDDGKGGTAEIAGTIDAVDRTTEQMTNNSPVFTDGTSTTRSVAENTVAGVNIGSAIGATDADNDILTYTLSGTDAASFDIDSTTGQLKTKTALDYETKTTYAVVVTATDDSGAVSNTSATITVTINVTDLAESPTDPHLSARTPQVRNAIVQQVPDVSDSADVTAEHLAAITTLNLTGKGITSLKAGDFNGLTSLTRLDLDWNNNISDISSLSGLTSLTTLFLDRNNISDVSALSGMTSLKWLRLGFNNISDISALENMTSLTTLHLRSNSISDISALQYLTSLTELQLGQNNISDISALQYLTSLTQLDLDRNSIIDISVVAGMTDLRWLELWNNSIVDISALENLTELRQLLMENNDITDYGPLRRLIAAIEAMPGRTLSHDITIPPVSGNNAPVFTDGTTITRSVAENTASGQNIGAAVAATDADSSDTLTYSLGGTDAASFTINSTNGQLRTSAALDYETKTSYTVTVSVSDGNSGTDSITVTINVTDVADTNNAPSFTDGTTATRSVAENTASGQNIGTAVAATDADSDTLTYTLGGTDAASFSIVSTSGKLQTSAALDYETKTSYSVTLTVSDGSLTDTINVTINVTDVNEAPVFTDSSFTYTIDMSTATVGDNIDDALTATDPDGDMLTFSVGGADAAYFRISSDNSSPTRSGQLQVTQVLIDDTRFNYAINVIADDGEGGTAEIAGTIDAVARISTQMTNNSPVFTDGSSTTRSIAENTAAGVNIGSAIGATDADNDTLTYTLSGADAASFDIDSTTGQLKTKTALDYETKTTYTVVVTATDDSGVASTNSANITVTINVTDVAESTIDPPLSERTPQVRNAIVALAGVSDPADVTEEHLAAITTLDLLNKGIRTLQSGDFDGLTALTTLRLNFNHIIDISALAGLTNLKTLMLPNNNISDISALAGLTNLKDLYMSGNSISDISPLSGLTSLTTLDLSGNSISELSPLSGLTSLRSLNLTANSISDVSPLEGVTSLRSLSLRLNSISDYGPLRRLKAAIVAAGGRLHLDIKIPNIPPIFVSTTDFSYTIDMSTATVGDNIGAALTATDPDGDMLTFSVGGAHAFYFRISSDNSSTTPSGQLQVTQALIDHTRINYSINVIVDDGKGGTAEIAGTIDAVDRTTEQMTNNSPVFTDGSSTTRSVAENTAVGVNIGSAIGATDADNDILTYTLSGTDAASFDIDSTTGQLKTKTPLDYETKTTYAVVVTATDDSGAVSNTSATITVTINVTDLAESPTDPPLSERTPQVRNAIVQQVPGVSDSADVTAEHLAAITTLNLTGKSITSLKAGDFNGLTSLTRLDLDWNNNISDISSLSGLTSLTTLFLDRNNISDVSALSGMTSLKWLRLGFNNISDISALENMTSLTTLHLRSNSISDISALSGMTSLTELQLGQNNISDISALQYLTSLTQLDLDRNSIIDISVVAGMTSLTWLELYHNSIVDISALENLTELRQLFLADNDITDYGPLRRLKAAIEAMPGGRTLSLDIAIPPVSGNNAPVFTDGTSTTRSVAENTASGQNIGSAVAATDADTGDTLTYTLGGTDAASFDIVSTSGQLQTKAALDYDTKTSYAVTVSVSDGNGGTDSITVTINVTDNNGAPGGTSPPKSALLPNFPNPFNPETWIPYQLSKSADVTLTIYNMRGVVVRQLELGQKPAGAYLSRSRAIHWDGRNEIGEKVATGVYFYMLKAGDFSAMRKMVIRK